MVEKVENGSEGMLQNVQVYSSALQTRPKLQNVQVYRSL